jgi:hypothetical protein
VALLILIQNSARDQIIIITIIIIMYFYLFI